MAGLGSEAVVPLRPELLNIRPLDFSVQQNAVALVADSFRQGQISADDIISRYGALAKTKEKAQIQGLDEFISPAAIATRQNQQAAANTDAILKSSPEYIAAREAEMQATINSAQAGSYPDMLKAAAGMGFFPKNKDTTWTEAKTQEARELYSQAQAYNAYHTAAARDSKRFAPDLNPRQSSEQVTENGQVVQKDKKWIPSGDEVNFFDENSQPVSKAVKDNADAAAAETPAEWLSRGGTSRHYNPYNSLVTAKGDSTAAKPALESVLTSVEKTKTETKPDGSKIESNEKQIFSPGRLTESSEKPIEDKTPKANEKQLQARLAASRMPEANDAFARLEAEHYDPTKLRAKDALGWLWPALSPDDTKRFVAASNSWIQGILRMESGASIAEKEKSWYVDTFFPKVLDPPELVASKKRFRDDYARTLVDISNAGGVATPESLDVARKLREQAGTNTLPIQAGAGAVETPISTGTLIKKPGGGFTVRAGSAVTSTNTPMVTPKLPSTYMTPPVVTPR